MLAGVALLSLIVLALVSASLVAVGKFRKLTKDIRLRANELPLAADLGQEVNQLRESLWSCQSRARAVSRLGHMPVEHSLLREDLRYGLRRVIIALDLYDSQVGSATTGGDPRIVDTTVERKLVQRMWASVRRIDQQLSDPVWELGNPVALAAVEDELEFLQASAQHVPSLLKERMDLFAEDARSEYHALIVLVVLAGSVGLALLCLTVWLLHQGLLRPLRQLVRGSQRVTAGDHGFRIHLDGNVEMSRLAGAFNEMTANFQAINENLAGQVEARSRELIRSEQLASVGMLAAGVAHEINNPLASIAWSAESLESRLAEWLAPSSGTVGEHAAGQEPPDGHGKTGDHSSLLRHLRRIQEEAFRCKKITGALLDFSRLGDCRKVRSELREIVTGVIDMLRPLGRYAERTIDFPGGPPLYAEVNPQEFRQVVLNLLTNALENSDPGSSVDVGLEALASEAVLTVTDHGCGMTPEVLQKLFEPFFTRRRDGQGTGLGLSITWRIVDEHGGQIHVHSDGPGTGSRFEVCLPLQQHASQRENSRGIRAAA